MIHSIINTIMLNHSLVIQQLQPAFKQQLWPPAKQHHLGRCNLRIPRRLTIPSAPRQRQRRCNRPRRGGHGGNQLFSSPLLGKLVGKLISFFWETGCAVDGRVCLVNLVLAAV